MPPDPFSIRSLAAGDVAAMRAMLDMFGEAFHDLPTYIGSQPLTYPPHQRSTREI